MKKEKKEILFKLELRNFYECDRCLINSLTSDRMCPCPRGGCDAKIKGRIEERIKIIRND